MDGMGNGAGVSGRRAGVSKPHMKMQRGRARSEEGQGDEGSGGGWMVSWLIDDAQNSLLGSFVLFMMSEVGGQGRAAHDIFRRFWDS